MKRNPKQVGSILHDCRPQTGLCPNDCNQCFYNRIDSCYACDGKGRREIVSRGAPYDGPCPDCNGTGRKSAFYKDINQPSIPSPETVGEDIVRMNCGHDSNLQRDVVIETAQKYKNFFFNTSMPNLNFPGPVVLTINPNEEDDYYTPSQFVGETANLMFVRFRVSPTNLHMLEEAVQRWSACHISVVLTFMAYYNAAPPGTMMINLPDNPQCYVLEDQSGFSGMAYTWQKRLVNSYYCATEDYMQYVTKRMKRIGGREVTRCGKSLSRYCRDCQNCSSYYYQTTKHLQES